MDQHRYRCDVCPFATSDEGARRGHEQYLDTHPRGWLGHGEAHTMYDVAELDARIAEDRAARPAQYRPIERAR